jgi:capsular exopolysaccharide synthesis family protein
VSKLFETIKRTAGEIPDLVRTLADAPDKSTPSAAKATNGGVPAASALPEVRTVRIRVPAPSPLLPFQDGQMRPSEQYRILRTKIGHHPRGPHLIVISSPASGDGKTVTAINTAAALSLKSGARVLLVDADLRRSAIHTQLGLPESPGLAEVLKGDCGLDESIVRTEEFPNLFVMPAGKAPPNPVELLDTATWQALCAKLRELFRYVILDSPPIGALADYDLIQAACDGVIMVVRPDHTNRELCDKALKTVPKPKFLGVLLNCVPDWSLARHAGSDYYYYSGKKEYKPTEPGPGA